MASAKVVLTDYVWESLDVEQKTLEGLASLVALLDPEVIVVGGGAARAGDILLQPARDSIMAALEGSEFRRPTPLLAAGLGQDAGIIGAGLAAAELARG